MLFILFGLPGAGKTFAGSIFQKYFQYHFYDGDLSLPEDMRKAINTQDVVTDNMRDEFFTNLLKEITRLHATRVNLVIAQTYLKEKYREQILKVFPEAKFVLIQTDTALRESRLLTQKTHPLTLDYVRQMVEKFDRPTFSHATLINNTDGEIELMEQIVLLLGKK